MSLDVPVSIEQARPGDSSLAEYRRLRIQLWPACEPDCATEIEKTLADSRWAVFLARDGNGGVVGFLETNLREYADGAETSPVGYLEGLYVEPAHRQRGIARALIETGERWARARGCTEIASDCLIDNEISFEVHKRMGYQEVERQICFLKRL
jgi:aminoglycoside 6'-N-acetyltransferase I